MYPGPRLEKEDPTMLSNETLIEGGEYRYENPYPKGCEGHHYRLHRVVMDVPSRQYKLLVEGLSGEDHGRWFTCTVNYFKARFVLVEGAATVMAGEVAPEPMAAAS